jgi:3',5'-cyclic AMP phosphodiesterase CpdA
MATFVLAHLSDPHLAPLPRPRLAELAGKRALGFVNWRRKRHLIHRADVLARIVRDVTARVPDHIAVTGDLVNISLAGEYPPARGFLETLGLPSDVTLVPGNHDVYVRGAARQPQTHWGAYMRGDDAAGPSAGDLKFPFMRRRGPLALIGLSSAVPTAPFMATGRLGVGQLHDLAAMLDRCGGEERFRVVLIHHPPIGKRAHHFKRLIDGKALRATLVRHGAELVIHGHDHVHSLAWLAGPHATIPVVGVPSASAAAPSGEHQGAAYNLYRIEGTHGAWRIELIARGLAHDGASIVELKRELLVGG